MDGRVIPMVALLACGGASDGQLRTRASFDMVCAQDQLQISHIDARARLTRGVTGCGRRYTYFENCERKNIFGWRAGCTWILNEAAEGK